MRTLDLESTDNPLIVADRIGYIISDGFREGTLSLFDGFLLNHERIRIGRRGYHEPAWHHTLSISGVIRIYMHYLCALTFSESKSAMTAMAWLVDDLPRVGEKRPHYVTSNSEQLFNPEPSREWLMRLSGIRKDYDSLPDDDGPYHCEQFPWHFASPEDALLGSGRQNFAHKEISTRTEDLLVSIGVSRWC